MKKQRRTLIVANWKMNKTVPEAISFFINFKATRIPPDRDVAICPPFTSLSDVSREIQGTSLFLGAQNMHYKEKGVFTGEISPPMVKEFGCSYVILGHSERRKIFGEDDTLINKKVKSALEYGITPILCIGETREERKKKKTEEVVRKQVLKGLEGMKDIKDLAIAYEPVWAIGTGDNATPKQAQEVHAFIRKVIAKAHSKEKADNVRILYGGSVTPENSKGLLKQKDIDGFLVGGSSLDVEKFSKIVKS